MTSCLKRLYLSSIIVVLLTFATSLATKSNQLIRAHVNKLNVSPTICYGRKPNSIPMEKIKKELDEIYEIERNIYNEFTEKQSDDSDTSIKYFYIDVVAVADYFLYKKFSFDSLKLRTQIAHLFFGAKRIYLQHKFDMQGMFDLKIVINLVDIIIIEDIEKSILNKIREGESLTQVEWLKAFYQLHLFASKKSKESFDHIALFTALDIVQRDENGHLNPDTLGAAYSDYICNPQYSVSIIEEHWKGSSMMTLVHELGHSLGAGHDGEDNKCSTGYLMDPDKKPYDEEEKLRNRNKWIFSDCSRKEIASNIARILSGGYLKDLKYLFRLNLTEAKKIEQSQYLCDCLRKTIPIKKSVPDVSKRFLGLDYNITTQCILRGYEGSCADKIPKNLPCIIRYCKVLKRWFAAWNWNKAWEYCFETYPYRGTSCGKDKVCEAGYCRRIDELETVKMSFSSKLKAPCCCYNYTEPKNFSNCQHDYGLNLVIVTLLVCGILAK